VADAQARAGAGCNPAEAGLTADQPLADAPGAERVVPPAATDKPRDLVIRLGSIGHGSLKLGGHDVSNLVAGATLTIDPREFNTLHLTLVPRETDLEAEGVAIGGELREALLALGWTPPEGQR
jgi:hypothetical protein